MKLNEWYSIQFPIQVIRDIKAGEVMTFSIKIKPCSDVVYSCDAQLIYDAKSPMQKGGEQE